MHLFPKTHGELVFLVVACSGPAIEDTLGVAIFEGFYEVVTC
jgi:hypothetical protein